MERSETAYGIVPLRRTKTGWEVFLIQQCNGSWWGLPKGHMEAKEVPLETAKRELAEETHLRCRRLLSEDPLQDQYRFCLNEDMINKKVYYFLAEVEGEVQLDAREVQAGVWLPLDRAIEQATFSEMKILLQRVNSTLDNF
jgi:bis(5'-nucleosidyl)-tetraphosphatase